MSEKYKMRMSVRSLSFQDKSQSWTESAVFHFSIKGLIQSDTSSR